MGSLFLMLGISLVFSANCQDSLTWGNGVNMHLLKTLKMLSNESRFYEELCVDCRKGSSSFVAHPENCGVIVQCVPSMGIFLMKCSLGTLFDETQNSCVNPDEVVCRMDPTNSRSWSPCATKTPFRHPKYCRKYMVCIDPNADAVSSHASIVVRNCSQGEGFHPALNRCTPEAPCLQYSDEEKWSRKKVSGPYCGPFIGSDQKYWYNVTARYRKHPNDVVDENYVNPCPAATFYPSDSTACECIAKDTHEQCFVHNLANFASRTKQQSEPDKWISWTDAKNVFAAISGNATSDPNKGAFFEKTTYTVHSLIYNEMGKYFTLSFTFLPQRRNPGNPTGQMINGALPGTYALADNSACGNPSTFGCRLVVESQDFGKVMCSINSTQVDGSHNYHMEQSVGMQLNQPISVTLTRNDVSVKMEVEQRGNVDTKEWNIEKAARVMGTRCGLTLAAGSAQLYFTGFIDNLRVRKFCPK